jgi:D-alanine-D-alanine ligase
MSLAAFHAIDGAGLSRVDFLMSPDGEIFLNEINTMPGFTPISMYPRLWGASGLDYADLIDQLIGLGLERHAERALHALR